MELGVLGPLTLRQDAHTTAVVGSRRRSLLAALLAHHGATVGVDELVDALWPDDPPPSARHTLHTHVSRLRTGLGLPVEADDGGYRLAVEQLTTDAERFEADVDAATSTDDDARAVVLLHDALALWRGPPFGGAVDGRAARGEAARLTERRLHAAEMLVARLVATGRVAEAVQQAEALVGAEPTRESAWVSLIDALVAAGRPADAVAAYSRAADALDELGLLPSAGLRQAHTDALTAPGRDAPRPHERTGPSSDAVPGDVPVVPSSLVGRERDVGTVAALLDRARLVTLVGPGGVGKTRLALEVARRRARHHRSGARVVELTTLDDQASVPSAVLTALDVGTQGGPVPPALRRAGGLDLLVVLDNCEHVVDAVAEVLEHLLAGHRVTVLATSREPLGLPGEHVHVVEALTTHGADPAARRLFVERAVAAGARSDLDPVLVDRVVERLDGLPLAIEMAAARAATTALPDLAAALERELDHELARLRDPRRRGAERHRTLRAVIAWSEAVLEPAERAALHRWPVFSGPVEAQDAEAVLGAGPEVVEALVRRSLLVLDPRAADGRSRYRMLHTVRSAVRSGEPAQVLAPLRERHALHVLEVAREADARLRTPAEPRAVTRLSSFVPELRAAHAWAREHHPALGTHLSGALHLFAVSTLDDEVLDWAARLAPLLDKDDGVAVAHLGIAARLVKAGELGAAVERAQLALDLARDDVERLRALDLLADAPIYDGRFAECRRRAGELHALALDVGDPVYATAAAVSFGLTHAYEGDTATARAELARRRDVLVARFGELGPSNLGWFAYTAGEIEAEADPGTALTHLDRARTLADAAGHRYLGGVVRVSAASLRVRHGDPAAAVPAVEEVVRWWRDRADRTHLVTTLRNVVDLLLRLGEPRAAAELWAAVAPTRVSRSFGAELARLERARDELAGRLRPDELTAAEAAGRARDVDDAAEVLLDVLRTLRGTSSSTR
ncbi:transcriptional regulator [Cellulomonas sp. APG4]|uniref:BTAD domain-containing putative transcriptional regulator n=1 Tax=Cellulomonas sp. APG4 TaxID=1538656 RepID=UPI00137A7E34|nr:BTAD domain-containing putative transcriptional regulator [Cellulomonas sp. APG4]NCT89873.1 transcriptional regulator [Cellulomonas sp. APG4]